MNIAIKRLFRSLHHKQILFRVRSAKITKLQRSVNANEDIIVSLTSYGLRLQTCHLAIRSLFQQTIRPNRIQLYIGSESAEVSLPDSLLELQEYGLEIIRDVDNLKSHKKYFFCMQANPNNTVITVDDDCIYPSDMIENLFTTSLQFPQAVIARRVHRIVVRNGQVSPYSNWNFEWVDKCLQPRNSLIAVGVGGILYPAGFADSSLLDANAIFQNALSADDIWLKCYESYRKISVVWAPNNQPHPIQLKSTLNDGLNLMNISQNRNDIALKMCMKHFNLSSDMFIDHNVNCDIL